MKNMPYPNSPFKDAFNIHFLFKNGHDDSEDSVQNVKIKEICKWLCEAPKITSYRVNSLLYTPEDVLKMIKAELEKVSNERNMITPSSYIHNLLSDTIIVEHYDTSSMVFDKIRNEVIVDVHCAAAILRGSHIFAPGIIGMTSGCQEKSTVSVFADLSKQCKKGYQKIYDGNKIYLGNGIIKMARNKLFGENLKPVGIAVEMIVPISGCPPLGEEFLPNGAALLQNLPSIVCIDALNPLPKETVLDMCASPGNKTTHIAAKMKNEGILIAIDKTPSKITKLNETCSTFFSKVKIFQADSTKIFDNSQGNDILNGPPFPKESFHKILLDAPCSALGKRPQFSNTDSVKVISSFVPLQRKLFETAVHLLKVDGTLIYSTCTITTMENECLVSWALRTFNCLTLEKIEPPIGEVGWSVTNLSNEQVGNLQRFGPNKGIFDSVGFFIAKFVKIKVHSS